MPFEPEPDRMEGDRDDQGEKRRPDDSGDGSHAGQCDRESGDTDQDRQGERTGSLVGVAYRDRRAGHLMLLSVQARSFSALPSFSW